MAATPATFADAMSNVLADIAKASLLPDADIQFCVGLQMAITSKLKAPHPAPGQGGMGAPPMGAPGMGGPPTPNGPGIPGGLGGQMAGMPGPGGVGPANGQQPPNVDELRRTLATQAGA